MIRYTWPTYTEDDLRIAIDDIRRRNGFSTPTLQIDYLKYQPANKLPPVQQTRQDTAKEIA